MDNMLVMMERYQMRLEDLVDEKTSQLQLEKKKTENLLHRMLPPYVVLLSSIAFCSAAVADV